MSTSTQVGKQRAQILLLQSLTLNFWIPSYFLLSPSSITYRFVCSTLFRSALLSCSQNEFEAELVSFI